MNLYISVPDNIVRKLETRWPDLSRRTQEALALEAYRSGILTEAEVQEMLGFASRWEVAAFLKQAQAYLDYTEEDLERDIAAIHTNFRASPKLLKTLLDNYS